MGAATGTMGANTQSGQGMQAAGQAIGMAAPVMGMGMSIFQMIQSAKEQREAGKAAENYQRQKLDNKAEGLQVSTMGSDLTREEAGRTAATQVDAAQAGGARTIIGAVGKIANANQAANNVASADLDRQRKEIDQKIYDDNVRIRGMQENRENADLAALSSQYASGKNDMSMGMGNMVQATGNLGQQLAATPITPRGQQTAVEIPEMGFAQRPAARPMANPYVINPQFGNYGSGMINPAMMPQQGY